MQNNQSLLGWVVGLFFVSMAIGTGLTYIIHKMTRQWFDNTFTKDKRESDIEKIRHCTKVTPYQPFFIGLFERVFFTFLTAFDVQGIATAMVAWIGIKMVAGWNRIQGDETWRRALGMNAMLNSLASLFFAFLGGLIIRGAIPIADLQECWSKCLYSAILLLSILILFAVILKIETEKQSAVE